MCGLCGNYDGDWNNDFMTRGGEAVVEPAEFGNSWRVSATCPEASGVLSPCSMRPYRQAWAIRQCSILKSEVFRKCHTEVSNLHLHLANVTYNEDCYHSKIFSRAVLEEQMSAGISALFLF